MIKKIGILALVATLVASMTVASALACPPGLSPGYWKHNVKVYCGGPGSFSGDPHETPATMEGYAAKILVKYAAYIPSGVDTPQEFLTWANGIFQNNANKALWLPLANAFNWAAGRLPYSD